MSRRAADTAPPFSPVSFALATALIGLSFAAGLVFAFARAQPSENPLVILGPTIAGSLLAGVLTAKTARSVGTLELLLACLLVLCVALLFGQFGQVRQSFPSSSDNFFFDLDRHTPGEMYLGPTWPRDVATFIAVAFLQAVTASSLFFMRALRLAKGGFEQLVGWRYLQAKRRDARVSKTALIAAIGVSFGVAALIAVSSAMSGYMAEVTDRILDTNAHLIVQRLGRDFTDYDSVQQKIEAMPEVVATAPFVYTGGMLSAERGMFPVLIKGIDPDEAPRVSNLRAQLRDADIAALKPKPGALPRMFVGKQLYAQLGLKINDEVSLVSPVAEEGKRGAPPRRTRFTVVGQFTSGMNDFDQRLIYIELNAAREFVGVDTGISGLEVKSHDPNHLPELGARIRQNLGGIPWRTIDWKELNSGIFSALSMQKILMQLILLFIVIVAAFNIASTLFMLVIEKTREVAVLKALGARDGSIMAVFVAEGYAIAIVGIASGVLLGLFLCFVLANLKIHIAADVYLIDTLRIVVKPLEILAIAIGALQIAHLSTLYPALKAARTMPVDALRHG